MHLKYPFPDRRTVPTTAERFLPTAERFLPTAERFLPTAERFLPTAEPSVPPPNGSYRRRTIRTDCRTVRTAVISPEEEEYSRFCGAPRQ
ncbi:MAG: hypothetical protein H6631_02115 [Anaerolineaceae bacterium]|nr:hypothetical protein [Anaerolineaceae bacterium]